MSKGITIFFLFFFSSLSTTAQVQDTNSNISQFAEAYLSAMAENNYLKLSNMTYSNIVSMAGGTEVMVFGMEQEENKTIGYYSPSILNISPIYHTNIEHQALVTYKVEMIIDKAKFDVTRHLLAISESQGLDWKFVDLEQFDTESLKLFVPSMDVRLKIPQRIEPTNIKK